MKNTTYFILFLFIGFTFDVIAQHENWREHVIQLAEEDEANLMAIENMYEELLNLESNPLNLNTVSREELEAIPLLSNKEVNLIIDFLKMNRPVMTIYELRNVRNLNYRTIQLIIPFFYVGDVESDRNKELNKLNSISDALKLGSHELQMRLDKTLTPRAGYKHFSDSILERYPNRKYRGEDFYNSIRYSLRIGNKAQMGFTAEKDAGEPLIKRDYPNGYDHYGFHFIVNNIGKLNTLAIGDYRLSFGQGLILNNDYLGSKSWRVVNVTRRTLKPKRHFSTSEYGFFRGGAAMFDLGNISLTTFYSNKLFDSNISEKGEITSFKTDGLHRTPLEMSKKRNTREQVFGTNINYRKNRFQTGISGVFHVYNKMYNPTLRDYNRHYLRGLSNFNASIDYSYQLPGLIFAGETAMSKNGSVATINSIQYRPSTTLSLSLLHRNYPISYNALHAQSFAEGSRVQNEKGVYFGAAFRPFKRFTVSTYVDFVGFPWPKYGIDKPSKTTDYYLIGTYTLTQHSTIETRYKYKKKEKNIKQVDSESKMTLPYYTHKLRLRYTLDSNNEWNFRTTVDIAKYKVKHYEKELGIMISQNINYKLNDKLSINTFLAGFNADTYNARLYSYERNLLSTFYMPSFYGKGVRYALNCRYNISSSLSLSIKTARTRYFNREVISSGADQINGRSRTDIYTYIRWRF
jgi:hypothetical protein